MKPDNIKNHYFEKYLLSMALNLTVYVRNAGVSILQENLNYSPALSVICQILPQFLPQLQSYNRLLTRGIDVSLTFFWRWFGGCVTLTNARLICRGGCLKGVVIVFLKLELCNLMNPFRCKFRQWIKFEKKNQQTNKTFHGPYWPKLCILGEISVYILLESLKISHFSFF